jgi:hypothetical protein
MRPAAGAAPRDLLVRNIRRRPKDVRRPPEITFALFEAVIASLQVDGVPERIDSSVVGRFRPGAAEVMPALCFLGQADDAGAPSSSLHELVAAHRSPEWPEALRDVLVAGYALLFRMPLERITPAEFQDGFRRAYPQSGHAVRKATAFFLRAAIEAEVALSPRIARRRRRGPPRSPDLCPRTSNRDAAGVLIDMLDPEAMSEEEQKAVVTLLLYLQES